MAKSPVSGRSGASQGAKEKRTTSAGSTGSAKSGRTNTGNGSKTALSKAEVARILQNSLWQVNKTFGSVVAGRSPQGLTLQLPAGLAVCATCRNIFAGDSDYCDAHVIAVTEVTNESHRAVEAPAGVV